MKEAEMVRQPEPEAALSWEDVARLYGPMPDWKIAKIVHSQATYRELELAMRWAGKGTETRAAGDQLPSSRVAYLHHLITAPEDVGE